MTVVEGCGIPPIYHLLSEDSDDKESPIVKLVQHMDWKSFSSLTMTCRTFWNIRSFEHLPWLRLCRDQVESRIGRVYYWAGEFFYSDFRRSFLELQGTSSAVLENSITKDEFFVDENFRGKPYLLQLLLHTKCHGKKLSAKTDISPTQLLGDTLPVCDIKGREAVGGLLGWAARSGDLEFLESFLYEYPADYYYICSSDERLVLGPERGWPHSSDFQRMSVLRTFFNYQNEQGESLVFLAAKHGHASVVEYLGSFKQVDINTKNKLGESPFYIACKNGHAEVLRAFHKMERRVDLHCHEEGDTPIRVAIQNEHAEALDVLVNTYDMPIYKQPRGCSEFHIACEVGNRRIIDILMHRWWKFRLDYYCYGLPALLTLAVNGHYDLVDDLLSEVEEEDRERFKWRKETPLQAVMKKRDFRMMGLLIEKIPNLLNDRGGWEGESPFYRACRRGDAEAVAFFLQYEHLDINGKGLESPIRAAVECKSEECLRLILDSGREDLEIGCALNDACLEGRTGAVKLLINHPKTDCNYQYSNTKQTPMHVATTLEIAEILFEHPDTNLFLQDNSGVYAYESCAQIAVLHDSLELLQRVRALEGVTLDDQNLLYIAFTNLRVGIFEYLLQNGNCDLSELIKRLNSQRDLLSRMRSRPERLWLQLLTVLVQHGGIDLNLQVTYGKTLRDTVLYYCVTYDCVEAMKIVYLEHVDKETTEELFAGACSIGSLNVVRFFVEEMKIDYNQFFVKWDGTVLHFICQNLQGLYPSVDSDSEHRAKYDKIIETLNYFLSLPYIDTQIKDSRGNKPADLFPSVFHT